MKKFVLLTLFLLLAGCNTLHNKKDVKTTNIQWKQAILNSFSIWVNKWIMVWLSSPNAYSHQWPKLLSGSYYFDPMNFFLPQVDVSLFDRAYSNLWTWDNVYYYDENDGAQAGLVVYILRNIYHKKNVSLLENAVIKSKLHYTHKFYSIVSKNYIPKKLFTWGYIGTWKYLVAYDLDKIKYKTGDLVLYSSDIGTMKLSKFYKTATGVNIESFDWTKLMTFSGGLLPLEKTKKLLTPLKLDKYRRVFVYYPKYRYRSGVLALYLQQYFK